MRKLYLLASALALVLGLTLNAAQLTVNVGTTANDGTGDTLRSAFGKVNTNFTELYAASGTATNLSTGATGAVLKLTGALLVDGKIQPATSTSNLLFDVPSISQVAGIYVGTNSSLTTARIGRDSGNGYLQIAGTNYIAGTDSTEYFRLIASSKGLTLRPGGSGGVEVDAVGLRIGYHGSQAPLYPIQVGQYVTRSVDPAVNVSLYRTNDTGENFHGYSDSSIIQRTDGPAFNSFDARVEVRGTNDYDHYAGFQFLPEFTTTGTVTNLYGFYGGSTITNTTIGNYYGLYLTSPSLGSGASISGDSWGIYAQGNAHIGGDLEVISNSTLPSVTLTSVSLTNATTGTPSDTTNVWLWIQVSVDGTNAYLPVYK